MRVTSEQCSGPTHPLQAHALPLARDAARCESHAEAGHNQEHGVERIEILRVVFVAIAAAAVWFHLWEPFHSVSVIGLAATLIGGYPIFKEAFEHIIERRMTMELSMTIALVSALAIGEFFTALVITGFVLAAEILEGLTVGRGRRAIEDMLDFLPQTASVLRDGQIVEVPTQTIVPGEIVLIRPGSRIPVDGQVVSGHSFVEQAAITGEPMPGEKVAGSEVYAGTVNQAGSLQVRSTAWGKKLPSARSLKRLRRQSIRARRFKRRRIGWPATWCTSPSVQPCSHFSSRTISGRRSLSSSLPEPAVSRLAHRWQYWERLDVPPVKAPSSRAVSILKPLAVWTQFFWIRLEPSPWGTGRGAGTAGTRYIRAYAPPGCGQR